MTAEEKIHWPTNRPGPIRARAHELLSDGEWHNYEQLVNRLATMVPPGQAARRAETDRVNQRDNKNGPAPRQRVKLRSLDEIVRIGARAVVMDILKNKEFERVPTGKMADPGQRKIRLMPPPSPPLTFTKMQIAALTTAAQGLPATRAARRMGVSGKSAVYNNYNVVIAKLGVHTMAAAVHKARGWGVIPPAPPLSGADLELARSLLARPQRRQLDVGNMARLGLTLEEASNARRRLYCRYGVSTMPLLIEKLRDDPDV